MTYKSRKRQRKKIPANSSCPCHLSQVGKKLTLQKQNTCKVALNDLKIIWKMLFCAFFSKVKFIFMFKKESDYLD